MTEEEIAGLFDRVTRDLRDPWIDAVIRRAERDAGRIRRRHRALAAACSVLGVAAISVGGAAGMTLLRPSAAPAGPAAPQQAAGHGTHRSGPAPEASVPVAPGSPPARSPAVPGTGARTPMTAIKIMDQLGAMLPAGSTISDIRFPFSGEVEFDYNDGHGAVDFMFSVEPLSFYANPVLTCSEPPWSGTPDEGARPAGALPQSCVLRTLPDGSTVQDWVPYADSYGFYGYHVVDHRPDGTVVFAQVGNGTNHALPRVDRAIPPGSFAEWNALVESSAWHL
jgi:hypothetical protein